MDTNSLVTPGAWVSLSSRRPAETAALRATTVSRFAPGAIEQVARHRIEAGEAGQR